MDKLAYMDSPHCRTSNYAHENKLSYERCLPLYSCVTIGLRHYRLVQQLLPSSLIDIKIGSRHPLTTLEFKILD